ncbi:hypothetical protein B4N89_47090 [Embleya scabrispora]|uniref:Uncharacterized protein n=1 Tax=Embleya scabrispora TaxID=159449 RepID=A0A1T3NIE8_9ACTN|nr:hypothetical protein B4N89_47090 [Embleya scabrispora]
MNTTTTTTDGAGREPSTSPAVPALDTVSSTALRAPAVRRPLALRDERRLTRAHVHTTAHPGARRGDGGRCRRRPPFPGRAHRSPRHRP